MGTTQSSLTASVGYVDGDGDVDISTNINDELQIESVNLSLS